MARPAARTLIALVVVALASFWALHAQAVLVGVQDPAWAPGGDRIAVSYLDRIWTMTPEGRQGRAITSESSAVERDPVWSPDGSRLAFAANRGDGFDIFVVSARGGMATAVTSMSGDERWPSWTPDGRLVFAHRAHTVNSRTADPTKQWDLHAVAPVPGSHAWQAAARLTTSDENETYPRVSPDGARLAFVSDRDSLDDVDVFVMAMPGPEATRPAPLGSPASMGPASTGTASAGPAAAQTSRESADLPLVTRVTRARGDESHLSWAPDNERLAFFAAREGVGSVWVAPVDPLPPPEKGTPAPRPRPSAGAQLISRAGGAPAWSPDGSSLLIAGLPEPQPVYNGNPLRDEREPLPLFGSERAYTLWRVDAPAPVHEATAAVRFEGRPPTTSYAAAFERAWLTLRDLYYASGASAETWRTLRETYQPRAAAAKDDGALESVIDAMVAEQPLIKPLVTSSGAVVVSGHPLASAAGRLAFEKGGNVVDAMVAVSFALGVVEPEASGIGGDGAAVLYLDGMARPTVVDYKDQTPIRATLDNPKIMSEGRLVADGPAAANIPGVVAGLDYLHRRYGSGKLTWAELLAPAIALAEDGFVLDEALPTSVAVGRRFLGKHPEAARIYLPGGRPPRPGETFVNKDYAATLRVLAKDGGDAFYRGALARRIAEDLEAEGGIITVADLAQYRAIEREPIVAQYRGHHLYAGGPPVSTGIQLFESLQVLQHYQPARGARATTDANYFHHLLEAWKVRDPLRRVADPERWPVDFAEHLTPVHARQLFQKIDPGRALLYERVPPDDNAFPAIERPGERPPAERIGTGTTSFAVADAQGNMIAATQTLSTWGGTFYVSKGLGFLYNNHLRSSRTTPGYGALVPLMRSSTASVPTLVFRGSPSGRNARLAVGAAGNAWIPVSVYNIITAVIDGGLNAQQAVEAARFLPGRDPSDPADAQARIEIEDRFPRETLRDLTSRGHRFQKIGRKGEVRYGYASAVVVDAERGRVEGGAEPRRSHAAAAYPPAAATTTPAASRR